MTSTHPKLACRAAIQQTDTQAETHRWPHRSTDTVFGPRAGPHHCSQPICFVNLGQPLQCTLAASKAYWRQPRLVEALPRTHGFMVRAPLGLHPARCSSNKAMQQASTNAPESCTRQLHSCTRVRQHNTHPHDSHPKFGNSPLRADLHPAHTIIMHAHKYRQPSAVSTYDFLHVMQQVTAVTNINPLRSGPVLQPAPFELI